MLGAGATIGDTNEIIPGTDASTKLNPRLESAKRSCVSSPSSIIEATPWMEMSGTLPMSCPDWPSSTVMNDAPPEVSAMYNSFPSREKVTPLTLAAR